jgi:hypothetical protein
LNNDIELDFGQLAYGQYVAKTVEIRNISSQQVPLSMDALGLSSSFHILNAPRILGAGDSHLCVIEFRPQKQKKLRETLTVRSQTAKIEIPLIGHCITPTISIEPASGLLDMGDILPGDTVQKTLIVCYPSIAHCRPSCFIILLPSLMVMCNR